MKVNIIDISWPLTNLVTEYKDRRTLQITPLPGKRDYYVQETMLSLNVHTGTHVDAPLHFIQGGASLDTLSLSTMIGRCFVVDCTHVQEYISITDIQSHSFSPGDIVLFKTTNSLHEPTAPFDTSFVYLEAAAAKYLVSQKVKAIGIDYLGIERNQPDHATHTILMQANIPIIEGLRLAHVQCKEFFFCCLPLNIIGVDAAPARAILIEML